MQSNPRFEFARSSLLCSAAYRAGLRYQLTTVDAGFVAYVEILQRLRIAMSIMQVVIDITRASYSKNFRFTP